MLTASFKIDATHPSFAGHFPGNPVTPGVVTLDFIARGLIEQRPEFSLQGFSQVKFIKPLLPNRKVTVHYKPRSEYVYQFHCEENGDTILSGQIQLGKKAPV